MKPTPFHDENYWKSLKIGNLLGSRTFENGPCGPDSWMACLGYWSEPYAPISGYPVILPTVSDCLLWFRWLVLGYEEGYGEQPRADTIEYHGILKELADEIDFAIKENVLSSEEILLNSAAKLKGEYQNFRFYISCIRPLKDYMLEKGPIGHWKKEFGDETINFENDQFILSDSDWLRVLNYIYWDLQTCDAYLPGYEPPEEYCE